MARTIQVIAPAQAFELKPKRVAAYARVSTDSERLMNSLSAQVSYYSALIQNTPGWAYAGVYADEGITGTRTAVRDEFRRMLEDCEAGRIDLILTKSISRFARNTVDLLSAVRHLKAIGVEVRFEKENLSTFTADGELMLTLLASFAQEEVRSMSENIRWGIRSRFEQGIPHGRFRIFGYRWEGDRMVIVPEEAELVRRIFRDYLDGKTQPELEQALDAEGFTTRNGCRFIDRYIARILTNVTYTGCLLLQKDFVDDPITKRRRKNHGELTQYFIEDTHEPIIDRDTFAQVQAELARRRPLGRWATKPLHLTCFTGVIRCACHGCSFVHSRNRNHAKDSDLGEHYEAWSCSIKKKKGGRCDTIQIPDALLKRATADALGLDAFDEQAFTSRVDHIEVSAPRHLKLFLRDGSTCETDWVSTLRKDWWTPERRAAVSAWRSDPVDNPYKMYMFSRSIRCGCCGNRYRSAVTTSSAGEKRVWFTKHLNADCPRKAIPEEIFKEACARALGLEAFDAEAFERLLHHAEVLSLSELRFHFRDGHDITVPYEVKRQRARRSEESKRRMSEIMKEKWRQIHEQKASQNDSGNTDEIHGGPAR